MCVLLRITQHHLNLVSFKYLAEVSVPIAVLAAPTDGVDKYEELLASRTEVGDSLIQLVGDIVNSRNLNLG